VEETVGADGLVAVDVALNVVMEPGIVEKDGAMVESVPGMVVRWPSEETVTLLPPGMVLTAGELEAVTEGADEEVTEGADEMTGVTVAEVAVTTGGGADSEVAAEG
jgi:hypothetical protein